MRALVTGCVRSSSGTRSGASWVRRPGVEEAGHRSGVDPAAREQADADAVRLVFVLAGEADLGLRRHALRRGDRAHVASEPCRSASEQHGCQHRGGRDHVHAGRVLEARAMCRWVTCDTRGPARLPARSPVRGEQQARVDADVAAGSANALMVGLRTRKKLKSRLRRGELEMRSPSDCRYSLVSGSSSRCPESRRPRITMRPMRASSSMLSVAWAAVPISGSWSAPTGRRNPGQQQPRGQQQPAEPAFSLRDFEAHRRLDRCWQPVRRRGAGPQRSRTRNRPGASVRRASA